MRLVLQRVTRAEVRVGGVAVAAIGRGLLVLAGVEQGDGEAEALAAARKVAGLRIFEDAAGRMNRSVGEIGGALLLVSQFTLGAALARGRRPSFDGAAEPALAAPLLAACSARSRRPASRRHRALRRRHGGRAGQRRPGDLRARRRAGRVVR